MKKTFFCALLLCVISSFHTFSKEQENNTTETLIEKKYKNIERNLRRHNYATRYYGGCNSSFEEICEEHKQAEYLEIESEIPLGQYDYKQWRGGALILNICDKGHKSWPYSIGFVESSGKTYRLQLNYTTERGGYDDNYSYHPAPIHFSDSVDKGCIIPLFGHLYMLDKPIPYTMARYSTAHRLSNEELPREEQNPQKCSSGTLLGKHTFAIPFVGMTSGGKTYQKTPSLSCPLTGIGPYRLSVIDIKYESESGSPDDPRILSACIALAINHRSFTLDVMQITRFDSIKWYKTGDLLPFEDTAFRIVNIVPPEEPGARTVRGKPARLIGWVELDPTPIPIDENGNPVNTSHPN